MVEGSLSSSGVSHCADINSDGLINDQDLFCMESYMSGDMSRWLSCLNCDKELPEDAFSESEICNDGYDNNCDGMIDDGDSRCVCGSETLCGMTWDNDGGTSAGIKDGNYMHCLNVSWTSDSMISGGAQYRMISPRELEEKCNEDTWGDKNTYKCSNGSAITTYSCNFKYEAGFTYPDTVEDGEFGWQEGFGNLGPVGTVYQCNGWGTCAEGWEEVQKYKKDWGCCDYHHCVGIRCGCAHRDGCTVCRFEYDHCDEIQCATSGKPIIDGRCSSAFNNYRETCPEGTEGECMGQTCPSGCSYSTEVEFGTISRPDIVNGIPCPCGHSNTCGGVNGCYSCIPEEECPSETENSCEDGQSCVFWTVYEDSSCTTPLIIPDGRPWYKKVCMPTSSWPTLVPCQEEDGCCVASGHPYSTTPATDCIPGHEIIIDI